MKNWVIIACTLMICATNYYNTSRECEYLKEIQRLNDHINDHTQLCSIDGEFLSEIRDEIVKIKKIQESNNQ